MTEETGIPQAALSAPETREHAEPVLCIYCGTEVSMIDRQGACSAHPLCKKAAAERAYPASPAEQEILSRAAASPVVRRTRQRRTK